MSIKQKPYISKDSDGWHILNSSGHIIKTFSDPRVAQMYLDDHWTTLST